MIHSPSFVACKPFGWYFGVLKTISTFPTLRVGTLLVSMRAALAIGAAAPAAARAKNSLRRIMNPPFAFARRFDFPTKDREYFIPRVAADWKPAGPTCKPRWSFSKSI